MGFFSKLFNASDAAAKPAPAAPAAVAAEADANTVAAPVTGTVVALSEVPDAVFAGGMLGQGCGIEPSEGTLFAPISGTLTALAPTLHAVGITGDDGIEVLVHVGVDTVEMGGEGFSALTSQGAHVTAGEPLVTFDLKKIAEAGHPSCVIVVVSNTAKMQQVATCAEGSVRAGAALVKVTR